jgi:hypothetical protein
MRIRRNFFLFFMELVSLSYWLDVANWCLTACMTKRYGDGYMILIIFIAEGDCKLCLVKCFQNKRTRNLFPRPFWIDSITNSEFLLF